MCTDEEAFSSVVLPDGFGQGAPGIHDGGTVAWVNDSSYNCQGWTVQNSGTIGMIMDLNGLRESQIAQTPLTRCSNAHPIMCCAPMPIPVTLSEPSASLGISTGVFALLALNAGRG